MNRAQLSVKQSETFLAEQKMSCLIVGKIQRQTTQRKGTGWKKKTFFSDSTACEEIWKLFRQAETVSKFMEFSKSGNKKKYRFISCKSIPKWIQQLWELLKLPFHCEIKQLIEKYLDNFWISKIIRSLGLHIFRRKVCICLQDEKSIY